MIINSNSVASVIKRSFRKWTKHIVFPDFQRPYCWTSIDIQKILDDIDELRYSPTEERYRQEDEYYLGAICFMPAQDSDEPEHAHDLALLDGQQRLTSLMILAHILYDRAMKSTKPEIRKLGDDISKIMGPKLEWKQAFLYREPATLHQIRKISLAIDSEYRQMEDDAVLDTSDKAFNFYEETLLRDLRRFHYILDSGRFAVTVLNTLAEAEQYFQGENNRGLPMSLLDILKAYHMRFETNPEHLKEIRHIWTAFNDSPQRDSDCKTLDAEAPWSCVTSSEPKQAVEAHVIPALLMRYGIEPWAWSANIPQNADLLKGIIGTHRHDRIVDGKLSASTNSRLFDLLGPIQTGIGFFRMLEQYRRIDEAIDKLEKETTFNPLAKLSLNNDQKLILRLALIAWVDRFAPCTTFTDEGIEKSDLTNALATDAEFRSFARHFARFLNRLLRNENEDSGAFKRLKKHSLLRCLRYSDVNSNLIFLPHRSATPAACKRTFLSATTPEAMKPFFRKSKHYEGYRNAYDQKAAGSESTTNVKTGQNTKIEASDHE